MKKEEIAKIIAIFVASGVKFDVTNKKMLVNLWHSCLKDLEYQYVALAVKQIIKTETELFANGLIAKVRIKAKSYKEIEQMQKQIEAEEQKKLGGGK